MQRIQPIRDSDAVPRATPSRVFVLKRLDFPSKQVATRVHDPVVSRIQLRAQFLIGREEFEKRNWHTLGAVDYLLTIQLPSTSTSILVRRKHSSASRGWQTTGSFSLKLVLSTIGTPVSFWNS